MYDVNAIEQVRADIAVFDRDALVATLDLVATLAVAPWNGDSYRDTNPDSNM